MIQGARGWAGKPNIQNIELTAMEISFLLFTFKNVLYYIQGTIDYDLCIRASSSHSFINYFNVDWGMWNSWQTTFRYCGYLSDKLIFRSSKQKHTISRSSAKPKYKGVANIIFEGSWLQNLLLRVLVDKATII